MFKQTALKTAPNLTKQQRSKTHQVTEDSSKDTKDSDNDVYANLIIQIARGKKGKDYIVEIKINSKMVKFEIDNGAHLSLINGTIYDALW